MIEDSVVVVVIVEVEADFELVEVVVEIASDFVADALCFE